MLRSGWRSRFVAAVVLAAAVGGCGEPGTTPSGTPPPAGFLLRASLTQALAPENVFAWTPPVTITGDRILVTTGPVPAIFPGPLLPNLRGRAISQAGYDRIVTRTEGGTSFWYYRGDTLLAVDAMNDGRAYMVGKRLIEGGKSPTAEAVTGTPDLKALLKA